MRKRGEIMCGVECMCVCVYLGARYGERERDSKIYRLYIIKIKPNKYIMPFIKHKRETQRMELERQKIGIVKI